MFIFYFEASNEQFKVTGIKNQKLQYKIPNSKFSTSTQNLKNTLKIKGTSCETFPNLNLKLKKVLALIIDFI
ncbi:hypothetical protein C1631_009770 [Chryseobacterium phosphatilyticum]|uniref:Uncharacterized protein n=1 Tax=Chryseobacterium phosphatilyticum TaxID=475075 RepID=A0A316X8X8_9FLAO|nr:hypothetical protein C1631_009770 [Chryseobacterium phosphatilyticum]